MVSSFLLIWTPYAAVSIYEIAGFKADSVASLYLLVLPTMLTKSSVCIDPIIYFGLNPQFQSELSRWLGRGSTTSRPGGTTTLSFSAKTPSSTVLSRKKSSIVLLKRNCLSEIRCFEGETQNYSSPIPMEEISNKLEGYPPADKDKDKDKDKD